VFLLHQFLATIGVLVTTGILVTAVSPAIQIFEPNFRPAWILTGIHFFPAQIAVGMASGYRMGQYVRTIAGMWVWVLPALILISAITASAPPDSLAISAERLGVPVEFLGRSTSRFSHFFGTSCDPQKRCLDQIGFTLSFYAASAYSVGFFLGRRKRISVNVR